MNDPNDSISSSSSILSGRLEDLLRRERLQREAILAAIEPDDEARAEMKGASEPIGRVGLYRLEVVSEDESPLLLLPTDRNRDLDWHPLGEELREVQEPLPVGFVVITLCDLHDLAPYGRSDVLRLGRRRQCDLRPWLDANEAGLDGTVSREHGLITYHAGELKYLDYGTDLETDEAERAGRAPGRTGSLNGTWLNDRKKVRNRAILWPADAHLSLGQTVDVSEPPSGPTRRIGTFRLRWLAG